MGGWGQHFEKVYVHGMVVAGTRPEFRGSLVSRGYRALFSVGTEQKPKLKILIDAEHEPKGFCLHRDYCVL
jgi:hypothetical protein